MTHPSDEWCDALAERVRREVRESGEFEDRALIRAGRATVAEDAARYRFIRDRLRVSPGFLLDEKWLHELGIYGNLDAAIDAARGKP